MSSREMVIFWQSNTVVSSEEDRSGSRTSVNHCYVCPIISLLCSHFTNCSEVFCYSWGQMVMRIVAKIACSFLSWGSVFSAWLYGLTIIWIFIALTTVFCNLIYELLDKPLINWNNLKVCFPFTKERAISIFCILIYISQFLARSLSLLNATWKDFVPFWAIKN